MKKLLLMAGAVATMATVTQAAVLQVDFGRTGSSPAPDPGWTAFTLAGNTGNPVPSSLAIGSYTLTVGAREDAGYMTDPGAPPVIPPTYAVPGLRGDNRSALAIPPGYDLQLWRDTIRAQGDKNAVFFAPQPGDPDQTPVMTFKIEGLAPNTTYAIEIGGADMGISPGNYNFILQPTAGSGTTGTTDNYGFFFEGAGSAFASPPNPANTTLTIGNALFTSDANGVLSFESVFDNSTSTADRLVYASYLKVDAIPEPASLGLLAVGGLMMLARRRHA